MKEKGRKEKREEKRSARGQAVHSFTWLHTHILYILYQLALGGHPELGGGRAGV